MTEFNNDLSRPMGNIYSIYVTDEHIHQIKQIVHACSVDLVKKANIIVSIDYMQIS